MATTVGHAGASAHVSQRDAGRACPGRPDRGRRSRPRRNRCRTTPVRPPMRRPRAWCGCSPRSRSGGAGPRRRGGPVTQSPGRAESAPEKWTSRPSRARPDMRRVCSSLRPSPSATRTSVVVPTRREVLLPRDPLEGLDQSLVALLDDGLRDLVVHLGCRRAGTRRVLEGERGAEACTLHDLEGVDEVRLGLPREPDDDVGGDRSRRGWTPGPRRGSTGTGRGGRTGASRAGPGRCRTAGACAARA